MELDSEASANSSSNVIAFPRSDTGMKKRRVLSKPSIGAIESKMRATLSTLTGTRYSSSFDWSIYDKIAARFGDQPPRGGVVFNTTLKLVNYHTTCNKCHYALEIDSYGRGCTHDCLFCYAKDQLTAHRYWNEPIPYPINLAEVRKIFYSVFETDKNSEWRAVLEKRIPLRLGSMSDSFMWMDRKYKVTQELLRILNFYRYPHIVFTRSDLIAEDEYLKIMDPELISIQISISGGNEKLTRLIEPGSPTVERRLKALRVLARSGFWTTVRINPLFPIYPDGYFTDPTSVISRFGSKAKAKRFDMFDWGFVQQLSEAEVPSVVVGFVRLSIRAINRIASATGIDLREFFKPEYMKGRGDKRYSDSEIAFYYKKIHSECSRLGMRFNTCYIGNEQKDYYRFQSLWTNKSDCCDANGNVPAFQTSSQEIPWDFRISQAPIKQFALQCKQEHDRIESSYNGETPVLS